MAEEVWDLFGIVRHFLSATNTTAAATATTENPPPTTNTITNTTPPSLGATFTFEEVYNEAFSFPNIVQQQPIITNEFDELSQLLTYFNSTTTSTTTSGNNGIMINTNSSDFVGQSDPSSKERRQQHVQKKQQKQDFQVQTAPTALSEKRKSQQKKKVLCRVPAENLSSDSWAWRKYGQKFIKGSPYPRNYYRCSSSRDCGAQKRVERSNTRADMLIVTYIGDHSHPKPTHKNSLAGSTRNRSTVSSPPPSSAPVRTSQNLPATGDDVQDEAEIVLPSPFL